MPYNHLEQRMIRDWHDTGIRKEKIQLLVDKVLKVLPPGYTYVIHASSVEVKNNAIAPTRIVKIQTDGQLFADLKSVVLGAVASIGTRISMMQWNTYALYLMSK